MSEMEWTGRLKIELCPVVSNLMECCRAELDMVSLLLRICDFSFLGCGVQVRPICM